MCKNELTVVYCAYIEASATKCTTKCFKIFPAFLFTGKCILSLRGRT